MGKYMKKAKPKGELALVESTTSNTTTSYMGVRTRAKTLALQKSHAQQHELAATSDSYLQLRSRRLQKPPILVHSPKRPKHPNPKSPIPEPPRLGLASERDATLNHNKDNTLHENAEPQEASFGENVLDFEGRERWVFVFPFSNLIPIRFDFCTHKAAYGFSHLNYYYYYFCDEKKN